MGVRLVRRSFSRAELEDMVRRWDFSENEQACRDLLLAAFPQAIHGPTAEECADLDVMDLLDAVCRQAPETAQEMAKLLLNTAEESLRDTEAARQLFQSAYVDRLQEEVLNACGRMGELALQRKLLDLLDANPCPHDDPELETDHPQ